MGRIKKIQILVSNDLSYDQRMQRIAQSMHDAGYEAELIGRVLRSSKPLKVKDYQQTRLRCFFNKGPLFYAELNIRLIFYLFRNPADLTWSVDADTLPAAYIINKLRGRPYVYDAHEYFIGLPELQGRKGVQSVWKRIEDAAVPGALACVTVSRGVAALYENRYKRKFELIRNMPEATTLPKEKEIEDLWIIYQGALNEGRGLEPLIRAMRKVPARLLLVGEGDRSTALRKLVDKLNLNDRIYFEGFKMPEELSDLTARCVLGINLLEEKGLSYYHSLANKFFSYVRAGIPQLCIDFPEYRMLNDSYEVALLIDDLSPSNIAAGLNELLENKALYDRLKENCLKAREHWTWEQEARKLTAMLKELNRNGTQSAD
jgi:glycosyltransferase involved in cell wall biosynthesis